MALQPWSRNTISVISWGRRHLSEFTVKDVERCRIAEAGSRRLIENADGRINILRSTLQQFGVWR